MKRSKFTDAQMAIEVHRGGWINNRAENSHLPLRRQERV